MDLMGRAVELGGRPVPLTRREYGIVELFAMHGGQVFSREKGYWTGGRTDEGCMAGGSGCQRRSGNGG